MLRLALGLLLLPATTLAEPRTYRIDAQESELVALTRPDGLLGGLAHPHVVVARQVTGAVRFDAAAPEGAQVEVSAPVAALEVDEAPARLRHHLEKQVSAEDRKKIAEQMRSPGQLDAERFPTLTFSGRAVGRGPEGGLVLKGALTLHGVAVQVTLPVKVTVEGGRLVGVGSLELTHAMFGMKPVSLALGTIRNAEALRLELRLVARDEAGGAAPSAPTLPP